MDHQSIMGLIYTSCTLGNQRHSQIPSTSVLATGADEWQPPVVFGFWNGPTTTSQPRCPAYIECRALEADYVEA